MADDRGRKGEAGRANAYALTVQAHDERDSRIAWLLGLTYQLMREEIERPGDCLNDLEGGRHLASLNGTNRVPMKVSHLRQVLLTPITLKP